MDNAIQKFSDNDEAVIAFKVVAYSSRHLVIEGMSGTGKTELIRSLLQIKGKKIIYLDASTSEIDDYFNIWFYGGVDPNARDYQVQFKRGKNLTDESLEHFKHIDTVIFDNAFFLKSYCVDWIDQLFRYVKGSRLRFGGVQMVYVGDFRAINTHEAKEEFTSKFKRYFFESEAFVQTPHLCIQLKKNYKYYDPFYINTLDSIRRGEENYLTKINESLNNSNEFSSILVKDDSNKTEINRSKLGVIWPHYTFSPIKMELHEEHSVWYEELILAVGSKVIITENLPEVNLVAGNTGIITNIGLNQILVEVEGTKIGIKRTCTTEYVFDSSDATHIPIVQIFQFPLLLAWAIQIDDLPIYRTPVIIESCCIDSGFLYNVMKKVSKLEYLSFDRPIVPEDVYLNSPIKEFLKEFNSKENEHNIDLLITNLKPAN